MVLSCGKSKITKDVIKVQKFKSIGALLKKHKPEAINPNIHTEKEAREMWYSFPGYKEKIKKYGLIAITMK